MVIDFYSHYEVTLRVCTNLEYTVTHNVEAMLAIESNCPRVALPYTKPECICSLESRRSKNRRHDLMSDSSAVPVPYDVEPM